VVGKRRKWKRSATAVADNSIEGRVGGVESLGAEGSEIRAARLRGMLECRDSNRVYGGEFAG
jgi:hypothetical protein